MNTTTTVLGTEKAWNCVNWTAIAEKVQKKYGPFA